MVIDAELSSTYFFKILLGRVDDPTRSFQSYSKSFVLITVLHRSRSTLYSSWAESTVPFPKLLPASIQLSLHPVGRGFQMSTSSRSDTSSSSSSLELEELLNIGARCGELRKEKDLLKASHAQSYGLIKKLELHAKRLNEAHSEDKRKIQELETELRTCCVEIESLQDKLKLRNLQIDSLQDEFVLLTDKLNQSKLEAQFLKEELKTKESELKNSTLSIEKLEETISSTVLESQCEIERLRLEMLQLEQTSDAIIETLEHENNEIRQMLDASQTQISLFVEKVEDCQLGIKPSDSDVSLCGEVLGPLLLKLVKLGNFSEIHEYEVVVKRLKEEVKEERLKAKEESEDLAQEMAELRYQMTELLEEERKRRASVEQISLQRIGELEKQLQIERIKTIPSIRQTD